jgi:hypothetical protein
LCKETLPQSESESSKSEVEAAPSYTEAPDSLSVFRPLDYLLNSEDSFDGADSFMNFGTHFPLNKLIGF